MFLRWICLFYVFMVYWQSDHFFCDSTTLNHKNNESFDDLYYFMYQIFGRKGKWLELKLRRTWMIKKEKKSGENRRMNE